MICQLNAYCTGPACMFLLLSFLCDVEFHLCFRDHSLKQRVYVTTPPPQQSDRFSNGRGRGSDGGASSTGGK
ncbi:hypothetical protein BDA96_05G036800 [Sorghum bicolor]|uniref:Secreted protein n=1 Tax=Sorghum bicolor TaxID=4558 RepID=A0A921QVF0_SORBI|nr:hypothetical protein BDA96_05G036800 [Sorghum bicolor]